MRIALSIIVVLLSLLAARSPAAESNASKQAYNEKYGVLAERNMFLRDRSKPSTRPSNSTSRPAALPEENFVLRGIVLEDVGYRAYFEDLSGDSVVRVLPGDSLARGKVSGIEIDAVEYD